ncbi:MAG: hypothetical protein QOK70_04890 [Nitrososphaeraceae archaeon]|nr:hypothetical protein [Nitrososphaeraceae archaeon]MDW0157203.1 hypothetical protein [Nitrososphaeraceae archaeon]
MKLVFRFMITYYLPQSINYRELALNIFKTFIAMKVTKAAQQDNDIINVRVRRIYLIF